MFEVGLLEKGFGADLLKGGIRVVYTTVKTVRILMFSKEILFDAFGTGIYFAEGTNHLLSKNGSVFVGTDGADLGFNDNIFCFLGHGLPYHSEFYPINFIRIQWEPPFYQ